jgi:hypothetical protein
MSSVEIQHYLSMKLIHVTETGSLKEYTVLFSTLVRVLNCQINDYIDK